MLMPLYPTSETHGDLSGHDRRRGGRCIGLLFVCLSLAWFSPRTASAADFTCTGGDVDCLIAAINTSNGNGEQNTIHLDASTYSLTTADNGPPLDLNGLPIITGQLAIAGVGRDATIIERANYRTLDDPKHPGIGTNLFRILRVASTGVLALERLTVRGGNGGIVNSPGAIESTGVLTIRDCAIVDNVAYGVAAIAAQGTFAMTDTLVARNAGGDALGSTILISRATATIERSIISDNLLAGFFAIHVGNGATAVVTDSAVVRNVSTGGSMAGIGAYNPSQGTRPSVTINNVTIAGHHGDLASGVSAIGDSSVSITHSTIADNSTTVTGNVSIENSILTHGKFGTCAGTITSLGHNLIEEPQGCGALSADDLGVPAGGARLGTLIDTGTTAHVPVLADSPAIDFAGNAACTPTDQRGLHRPIDGNADGTRACDAGAVEFYPVVNDLLQLDAVDGEYVPPSDEPNPLAAGGEFHIHAAFTNVDPRDICHVAFDVVTLNGAAPPVVLTPGGLLIGGQGAAVTAAAAGAPADLASQAQQQYQFRIGVPQAEGISFLVNVLGEATAGSCAP